jgi:CBS domain-containing protein
MGMKKASDVMIKQVITVDESAQVKEVLKHFITHRISGLPVINKENKVVGFISDGDILKNIGHHRSVTIDIMAVGFTGVWFDQADLDDKMAELLELNVMEIATVKVISVSNDTEIGDIAEILGQKKIKKVPVIQNGKLTGIISRGDLLRFVGARFL